MKGTKGERQGGYGQGVFTAWRRKQLRYRPRQAGAGLRGAN